MPRIVDSDDEIEPVQAPNQQEVPDDVAEFQVGPETDTGRGGNPARHWVFTIHCESPGNDEMTAIRMAWRPPQLTSKIRYLVCQQERGAGTGRLHWQGYVQFTSAVRAPQVRSLLSCAWAWVKPARGTPQQARAYCMKETTRVPGGDVIERGSIVETQGKRNDLDDVYSMIKGGARMIDVLDAQPTSFMRYTRGIQAASHLLRTAAASTTLRDPEIIVVWGPPGSGKSKWVWDTYGGENMYTLSLSGSAIWWDGYDGQETVLLDDYAGQIPFRSLLNYTDRYPVQCPVKGSMVWLAATRIIFTSNLHWSCWYQADPTHRRDLAALQRRISMVRHVPAWGAEHVVQMRGADPTDSALWVPLPEPTPHAPGFVAPV